MSATETNGTALITGASAGVGTIYADRPARRGYDLILVARNRGRLVALARCLRDETGRTVETIAADLNDKADLARIETTLRTNPSITLLVNNAGECQRAARRRRGVGQGLRRRRGIGRGDGQAGRPSRRSNLSDAVGRRARCAGRRYQAKRASLPDHP